MRTILITCFTGLISRNILSTGVLPSFVRGGIRVIILCPKNREEVLAREFNSPSVEVLGIETPPLSGRERLIWVFATNLLATATRRVQRIAKLGRDKNHLDYLGSGLLGMLGRFRIVRMLFRALVRAVRPVSDYEALFKRYHPDLLFATDVYTPYDLLLMRFALRKKVRVVGMVRSWDNVTSKTLLTVVPEFLVVNSSLIRDEVMKWGDVPEDRIFITGVPHYDRYRSPERNPREAFFKRFGFDPKRKLILFTPPSDHYLKHDPVTPVVLRALAGVGEQVLVRLPLVGKTDLGDFQPTPGIVFDAPENSSDFAEAHLNRATDRHLADSIFASDLVITWASTMIIDAAVFDKPIILVGFDASPRPYAKSIRQYYDYDHQRRIIETGGARLAANPRELSELSKHYLEDPGLDRAGRERLVAEYCGPLDGKSSQRLADFLLARLGN